MKNILLIMIGLFVILLAGCSDPDDATSPRTALLVIPSEEVQDHELTETKAMLENAGIEVTVASVEGTAVSGMLGGTFMPDIKLSDATVNSFDAIACIGGNGAFNLWENQPLIHLIQQFNNQGKTTAAICAASGILANAGILNGIDATCYPYDPIIELLTSKGATYVDQTVVVSGNIITGNGPGASTAFGQSLVTAIQK